MKTFDRLSLTIAVAVLLAVMFTACAQPMPTAVSEIPEKEKTEETGTQEESASPAKEDDITGEWVMAYYKIRSKWGDEDPYEYITMADDTFADQAELKIHKDGEKYIADYRYTFEQGMERFYGNELVYKEEPAYADCGNDKWCYAFSKPYEDDPDRVITMLDADTLIEYELYEENQEPTEEDEGYSYRMETIATFLRKDSPKLENMEDLRYFDTVTVSTTKELLDNIKNNTRVILKAGEYNFSDIMNAVKTANVDNEGGTYEFEDVSNLCLEAEEGAEVKILTNDSYSPVMSFTEGSYNIVLRGLTVGHNVEPGYCSGSVLYFSSTNGIVVENCHLYGSGTYGIEAGNCSNLEVRNTDIYECTYGLVSMMNTDYAHFTGCEMRDSSDLSMVDVSSCYDVVFEDCKLHNNTIDTQYDCPFVDLDEYSQVTFRNCDFKDNVYKVFSNYPVTLEKCNIGEGGQADGV